MDRKGLLDDSLVRVTAYAQVVSSGRMCLTLGRLFQRSKDIRPQLASFAERVRETYTGHASVLVVGQARKVGNEILESESLSRGLSRASLERDVHDVDVEVVVSWLIFSC